MPESTGSGELINDDGIMTEPFFEVLFGWIGGGVEDESMPPFNESSNDDLEVLGGNGGAA